MLIMNQFKRNLESLTRIRPDLAEIVLHTLPPYLALEATKTIFPTLIYRTKQGDKLLHSRYDPIREAQILTTSMLGEWDHLVVMGLGLGYSILQLLDQKKKNQRVLVYEPDPAIFSASLHSIDWGGLLSTRDDFFLAIGDIENSLIKEIQKFFSISAYAKLHISIFPGEKLIFHHQFTLAEAALDNQIKTLIYDFKTRLAEGGLVAQNILQNLPFILKTRPVISLSNLFTGFPGIIVSAGPSLDSNINLLHRVQGRCIIIAVDTALKPLLKNNIQPHFTVTADPSYKNYRHILGTEEQIEHFILAESAVSTRIFQDLYKQIITVSIGKPLLQFCESAIGPIGELDAWGSVISLATSLAFHLNLDPITFIGQDFAYTHMRNHCRHSTWEESLLLDNPKIESLQRFERQSIGGSIIEKTDIFGNSIYTSDRLALYKDYLVRMFLSHKSRTVFNSSEGGILHELPFLPLEEYLRRFVAGRPKVNLSKIELIPTYASTDSSTQLAKQFKSQIRFLSKYKRKVDTFLSLLSSVKPNYTWQHHEEAEELKQKLYHIVEHGNLVEMWSQFPIYTLLTSQKKISGPLDQTENIKQAVTNFQLYFNYLSSQLSVMIPSFERVVGNLTGDIK